MMKIEQLYTGCLAQGAYYIESAGVAAIIDPLRETGPYIEAAKANNARIKYIFETHFHADFVSGHLDLAKKTGATIVFGPKAKTGYEKYEARDGEVFQLGQVKFKVLHTPGHTPESICYLLYNEEEKPYAVFTGDTLFIGDVGRPDLAQSNSSYTKEDFAGWLYDSLRTKIMTLPDEVIVYPAHGAGSACGKSMAKETTSTIGIQKETNYALRPGQDKETFIKEVTEGLQPPPQYFFKNALLNKEGYESIDMVMKRGVNALSVETFETAANTVLALILDVRDKKEFVKGFIPNSIFVGIEGTFAPWVGTLIPDMDQPILLVAPEKKVTEAVTRLARVGYDNCIGYLEGGFKSWEQAGKEIDTIQTIDVKTFANQYRKGGVEVLDVRKPSEFEIRRIENAISFPLDFINQHMHEVKKEKKYFLHCESGYRSTIAASILKARGYNYPTNVLGTFTEMLTSLPTTSEEINSR